MERAAPDAAAELAAALRRGFPGFAGRVLIERLESSGWASITFTGARHSAAIRLEGPGAEAAADRFADGLAEREFRLRGHLVADIALVRRERPPHGDGWALLAIEALTVEDA